MVTRARVLHKKTTARPVYFRHGIRQSHSNQSDAQFCSRVLRLLDFSQSEADIISPPHALWRNTAGGSQSQFFRCPERERSVGHFGGKRNYQKCLKTSNLYQKTSPFAGEGTNSCFPLIFVQKYCKLPFRTFGQRCQSKCWLPVLKVMFSFSFCRIYKSKLV